MDTKWLEDFLSLARTGSFSKSAVERHVTQSAFSRRISALEEWAGKPLIDRRRTPSELTQDGLRFREAAKTALRELLEVREALAGRSNATERSISVAAMHTLALSFFPSWLGSIEREIGALHSRLLTDDFQNCLNALIDRRYDLLLTFHHPLAPVPLDDRHFAYRTVGHDRLVPVKAAGLRVNHGAMVPLLAYPSGSFLGKVAALGAATLRLPCSKIVHVNDTALAEALKTMTVDGRGVAWLPESSIRRELSDGRLVPIDDGLPLEIRLYRRTLPRRAVLEELWQVAMDMRGAHGVD